MPRLLPFARSFAAGAAGGVVTFEFVLLVLLTREWTVAIYLALVVVAIIGVVYIIGARSEPILFESPEDRKRKTRIPKILGAVLGFLFGISVFFAFLNLV